MKKIITKENIKINFKTLFWFLLTFLAYYLPFCFVELSTKYYLSLKHPDFPIWLYSLGWLVSTIALSLFTSIYIYKFRIKEDKENIDGYRRLFLYLFLYYLFTVVLITTFFNGNNLFLTYILCIAIFVISLFVLMETFLINKKDSFVLIIPILWSVFLCVISIILYLNN